MFLFLTNSWFFFVFCVLILDGKAHFVLFKGKTNPKKSAIPCKAWIVQVKPDIL